MNASNDNVYGIILAGGASSRLGRPKQLLKWQNQSLLEHAIQNARAFLNERVIVVLGAHTELIQTAVDLDGITTIVNPNWQVGVASSIKAGVHALPASATAVLFLLCDQPLINPTHIQTILNSWQNEPSCIVASQYNHSVGVPALFPAEFFRQLLELKGDQGAKRLLMKFSDRLLKIPLPEAGFDIDTSNDFDHLTGHYAAEE
jgi:molybdenum cofactor cytidylyltransferase